jgi:hypothetical protein
MPLRPHQREKTSLVNSFPTSSKRKKGERVTRHKKEEKTLFAARSIERKEGRKKYIFITTTEKCVFSAAAGTNLVNLSLAGNGRRKRQKEEDRLRRGAGGPGKKERTKCAK